MNFNYIGWMLAYLFQRSCSILLIKERQKSYVMIYYFHVSVYKAIIKFTSNNRRPGSYIWFVKFVNMTRFLNDSTPVED